MRNCILAVFVGLFLGTTGQAGDDSASYWPQWRGPNGTGAAVQGNPPIRWDEKTNIQWKVPLPGRGSSTPIVWGDKVFVTAAYDTGEKAPDKDIPTDKHNPNAKTREPTTYYNFMVFCFDRKTGNTLWKKTAAKLVPHEGFHPTHSYAAGSPVTDGKHLYVSFGSYGIFCYDLDGKLIWDRDLGDMHTRYAWGEGASPALFEDALAINWDNDGQSHVFVLNARTGKTLWQKKRDEVTTWATPAIAKHSGKTQLIMNGMTKVRSYDLKTGDILWQCGGQTLNAIPSPIVADGVAYVMSGYRGAKAQALPLDARGDITKSDKILWELNEDTPYVPSPLLMGDRLYFTSKNFPFLTCVQRKTGKVLFTKRLPLGSLYGSPTGVDDRLYITDRSGTTLVLKNDGKSEIVAKNSLDARIDASPVIVGNQLFLRGHEHLYCISEKK